MSYPNLIDPEVFAAEGQNLQGSFLLEELDERVSSHDYPADKQTRVSFTLQGGRDRLQRLFLDLNVKADMPLICQRCITPMPFLLDETSRIVLFADEESFDGLFRQAEAIDEFFVYGVDLLHGFTDGEAFVEDEALVDVRAVVFRQ